jgi:hypothetical protein
MMIRQKGILGNPDDDRTSRSTETRCLDDHGAKKTLQPRVFDDSGERLLAASFHDFHFVMSSIKSALERSTRGVSDLRTSTIRLNRLTKMLPIPWPRCLYMPVWIECNIVRIDRELHHSNTVSS